MQLHSGSYPVPWHNSDTSDLSMQWAQLSGPYSSTDRSSSLGSMESLDTPTPTTQPYSESHNSPVDHTLFINKRDSAYSSFSASSNTSDYATVQLRPGEACSMDNLLQSLGPSCQRFSGDTSILVRSGDVQDEANLIFLKSRSLTRPKPRPVEVRERPSSCCYEQDRREGGFEPVKNESTPVERKIHPPQPPTRKDSFKVSWSRSNASNKCFPSAPTEDCKISREGNEVSQNPASRLQNGYPSQEDGFQTEDSRTDSTDSSFTQRQTKESRHGRCDSTGKVNNELHAPFDNLNNSGSITQTSINASKSPSVVLIRPHVNHHTKHSTVLHRHSAPEKLLATQLQLLQFNNNNSALQPSIQSDSCHTSMPLNSNQWSKSSSLHPITEPPKDIHSQTPPSNDCGDSRSSTPGSVFLEGEGVESVSTKRMQENCRNGGSPSSIHNHVPWGRSVSVPGEATMSSTQEALRSDRLVESDFKPLSAAASMDTLLENQSVVGKGMSGPEKTEAAEREDSTKKLNSSKNYRRNRRRSERFATNLRNEIQRKKAQLQRSHHGPGGLLCSKETVHEEDCSDLCDELEDCSPSNQNKYTKVAFIPQAVPDDSQILSHTETSNISKESQCETPSISYAQNNNNCSRSVRIMDPGVPNFGVGIRVVEEPAPAGKARRWRWTPEHKLQPDLDRDRQCGNVGERVLGGTASRHGVCAYTSSSNSTYSCSTSGSRTENSDILPFADRMKFFEETSKGVLSYRQKKGVCPPDQQDCELSQHPTQRRYSYQEETQHSTTMDARRPSVSAARERQKEREQLEEREEREERLREMERQQERERQERELEMERVRLWEIQREQEERMRQWEREREIELERQKEAFEQEKERERMKDFHLTIHQHRDGDSQRKENFHLWAPEPQRISYSQAQNPAQRSAFYPVSHQQPPVESQESLYQGYSSRSYTPTESNGGRHQGAAKLSRNYSLTERDYPSWRRESRAPQSLHPQQQQHLLQAQWECSRSEERTGAPPPAPLFLRGRAMSESDLRFEGSHRWSPSMFSAASQTLSEVEEGGASTCVARQFRKKTPPPPRPPPPKWEQFHRRRASHHALLSSFTSSAAAPSFAPASSSSPVAGHHPAHSSSYFPPLEASRQRSYSLPPERQEVAEACPRCSCSQTQEHTFNHTPSNQGPGFIVAPPSPMLPRKAFRPVTPAYNERRCEQEAEPETSLPSPDTRSAPLYRSSSPDQERPTARPHNPQSGLRPGAEWESPPSPANRCIPVEAPPRGGQLDQQQVCEIGALLTEEQQRIPEPGTESETTLSPSPAHSLDADLEVPLETDIDDFQEEELLTERTLITSEVPCFAQPVTVLETDIDTLQEADEELEAEELLPQSSEGDSGTESWRGAPPSAELSTDSLDRRSGASSSCSSYYHTSAAKAQLLTQMKEFSDSREKEQDDELAYKKQLMESLRKKLGVLREAQRGLQEDIRANTQLGDEVESLVMSVCKPNEVDKYRMFIGDLDKVVSLMLSLSGRLLRVETTLDTLDPEADHQERLPLLEKKRQLMRQLSEAQDLKDHVDRREQAVSRVLSRCLSPDQHRDYSHFVKMKAALLVEQRQLEDKIRLGEEQLRGLRESLGLGLGLGLGMSIGYGHY